MKDLKEEIVTLIKATGRPMTSKEVFARCTMAEDVKEVSDRLGNLWRAKVLDREQQADGRFAYSLAQPGDVESHSKTGQETVLIDPPAAYRYGDGREKLPDGEIEKLEAKAKAIKASKATGNDIPAIPAFLLKTEQPAQAQETLAPSAFRCAVFNDGSLLIDLGDWRRVELSRQEAAQLRAYLLQVNEDLLCA